MSLKYLFGIVAFVAVMAWCVAQVGVDNGRFWIVLAIAAGAWTLCVHFAGREGPRVLTWIVPVFPLLLSLPLFSLALLLNSVLLIVAGIICCCFPPFQRRTRWAIAMACTAAAFVLGAMPGIYAMRELEAMRQAFPIISLAERLKYEQQSELPKENTSTLELAPDVSSRLNELDAVYNRYDYMAFRLRQVHSRQYERFIRANGFGVSRMPRPSVEYLSRPPLRDIPFDAPSTDDAETEHWPSQGYQMADASDQIDGLHDVSRFDFLDNKSLGVTLETVEQVVGFVEHGFHYSPANVIEDEHRWTINRLELVSLLKFDGPRVYVLDHLPRMDQLSGDDVPTRPLDDFESDALTKLRTDDDVVILNDGDHVRMLGSLRAANQCLDCHSAQRGELLGAFSYDLSELESNEGG
jgi:hypothetical protein